jgi:hypothetical protein
MATGIGNTIVKEITKLIIGGRAFFVNKFKEKSQNKVINETLKYFNVWSDKYLFQNILKQLVEYEVAGGTATVVSYVNQNHDLFPIIYRIDQFFYEVDFSNKVSKWTGFIGFYTAIVSNGAGRKPEETNFYMVEERYYEDKLKPIKKIALKRSTSNISTGQNFDISQTNDMSWEQLPKNIQKLIKKDFPDIKVCIEQPIRFCDDLGVDLVRFTTSNRIPEVKMGESALMNVIKYMIDYEYAESALDTDMYNGRGKILIPEQLRNPTDTVYQTYYSGYDSLMFTKMPMVNTVDQKPISIQFELRADEWQKIRNQTAEKIASSIGVGGSDIFSYLRDATGSSKTATQIADETRKTLSFVEEKRDILMNDLDPFFTRWCKYYNMKDKIKIKFSSQNLVNKMITIDEMRAKREIGVSTFDLFKEVYPDKDDEQVQEMVDRKFKEQERIKQMETDSNIDAFETRMRKINNGRQEGEGIKQQQKSPETAETEEIELVE